MSDALSQAYAVCRDIARREAKNFYYAFLALPRRKRDAICAIYAFMRRADDISDDASRSATERRDELAAWLAHWKEVSSDGGQKDERKSASIHAQTNAQGQRVDRAVFFAVADACRRFAIPAELLDQLVAGTAMDLQEAVPGRIRHGAFDTYATFADLYRYCYYVASVVGLVCIRIFGYQDPRAEKLAEETGVAFQLTNILRDVREDAERGRIYLPLEDLARFGVAPEELAGLHNGRQLAPKHRALLAETAMRARRYYQSARELLPLIDPDSRPALAALVAIYARLLRRIQAKEYDVFTAKIRVPTWQKLTILVGGLARLGLWRLWPKRRRV